jgi:hypothetical protein
MTAAGRLHFNERLIWLSVNFYDGTQQHTSNDLCPAKQANLQS